MGPLKNRFHPSYLFFFVGLFAAWYGLDRYLSTASHPSGEEELAKRTHEFISRKPLNVGEDDFLLLESIVAIVQNYYVDADRVNLRTLMEHAIEKLALDGVVEVEKKNYGVRVIRGGSYVDIMDAELNSMPGFLKKSSAIARLMLTETKVKDPFAPKTLEKAQFQFIDNMLLMLDPHSSLLDAYAYKELRQGTEGSFGGLGVVVGIRDHLLTVIKPIPRSPAARAGIKKDDRIILINDQSTFGMTLDRLVEHMRGAPGTEVELSLMSKGSYAPREISLKREVIQVDSVVAYPMSYQGQNILRLGVENFSARTAFEIREAILSQQKKAPLAGLILDLRGNPGGLLDQAVQVSDLFLKEGTIVSTKGRRVEMETAGIGFSEFDHPLVVLINGESASASEIVAGALRDNRRAVVIGQPSFGKGSVQTIFELPKEQALKLTIARYYTPLGTSIQNRGIMPDIWLQPLEKKKENLNLLGEYRYRSEKFLLNSLKAEVKSKSPLKPTLRGYYLTEKINEAPLDEHSKDDYELNFSAELLATLARQYKSSKSKVNRSSFFVARYYPSLLKKINQDEKGVIDFLDHQFSIDWSRIEAPNPNISKDEIDYKITMTDRVKRGQDSKAMMKWSIANNSTKPLSRVSVFLHPEDQVGETFEYLVGNLAPGEKKQGFVHFPLRDLPASLHPLRYHSGFAFDGMVGLYEQKASLIHIDDGPTPNLELEVKLVEEEGGVVKGVLEPKETAKISVRVMNQGSGPANQLDLNVVNLGGKQINIGSEELRVDSLSPGEEKTIQVPITVHPNLISSSVSLGITIDSENMVDSFKKWVKFPGKPIHLKKEEIGAKIGTH